MPAQSKEEAYDEIVAYINKYGGQPIAWYCGIASDWKDRLFKQHQVPNDGSVPYIVCHCFSDGDARADEKALLNDGCGGAPSGGDDTTKFVYAYVKTASTKE